MDSLDFIIDIKDHAFVIVINYFKLKNYLSFNFSMEVTIT